MEVIKMEEILRATNSLTGFVHLIPNDAVARNASSTIPKDNYTHLAQFAETLCNELRRVDFPVSLVSAEKVLGVLAEVKPDPNVNGNMLFEPMTNARLKSFTTELLGRVRDEFSARIVVLVPPRYVSLYKSPAPLFGQAVFDSFPSANDDIDEAGKCLAVGRGTACVMHLMRCAEVALKALGKAVDVAPQNNWGAYLRAIEKQLDARAKAAGVRTPDEQFYAEATTGFDHLKRAWRNPTMHTDRTYSVDRASEIFEATKSFMSQLAARIRE